MVGSRVPACWHEPHVTAQIGKPLMHAASQACVHASVVAYCRRCCWLLLPAAGTVFSSTVSLLRGCCDFYNLLIIIVHHCHHLLPRPRDIAGDLPPGSPGNIAPRSRRPVCSASERADCGLGCPPVRRCCMAGSVDAVKNPAVDMVIVMVYFVHVQSPADRFFVNISNEPRTPWQSKRRLWGCDLQHAIPLSHVQLAVKCILIHMSRTHCRRLWRLGESRGLFSRCPATCHTLECAMHVSRQLILRNV